MTSREFLLFCISYVVYVVLYIIHLSQVMEEGGINLGINNPPVTAFASCTDFFKISLFQKVEFKLQ